MARIQLKLKRRVTVTATGKPTFAVVWDNGSLLVGPAHDFGQRLNAAVRVFTDQFLGEWIKQNPKPAAAP